MKIKRSTSTLKLFKLLLSHLGWLLALAFSACVQANPWATCIDINYGSSVGSTNELRLLDKFGRDVTHADMPLMDWEGFIDNPQYRISLIPPANASYPVTIKVTAQNAPRLYLFQKHEGANPYDVRSHVSLHNEEGPMWGSTLETLEGQFIYGGVSHDLTDAELYAIGLRRNNRQFFSSDFPLELHVGIHPDRDGDDEYYQLDIEMIDANNRVFNRSVAIAVCDQDQPERVTDFKFHIDYSTDWDGYLETTDDGQAVKEGFERVINDIAYFFQDMRFDTMHAGQCEAFVNWVVEDRPSTATNSIDFDNGYYLFINSHSGGGGLSSSTRHTRDGELTNFPACGYWGANPREALSENVNTRIYLPEDDWWRTNSHMIYGRNGECIGDELGEPGKGCIECPNDEEWCGHQRGDIYWPNMHELNHGLTLSGDWTKWKEWFDSEELCVDDEALSLQTGTCLPVYKSDHVVTFGMLSESNKEPDIGRTLFKRYDILLMQAVGWELRETTMLVGPSIVSTELPTATFGSNYQAQIDITGGIPGYKFSISNGHLPPGLALNSFNGEITGQPTNAGSYTFTVMLQDSDQYNVLRSNGVTKEFTVEVQ